jgi:hypothetical protein
MISGLFFGLAFGVSGLGAAVLGTLADHTSIDFVYKVCSFLPALGLLTGFPPNTNTSDKANNLESITSIWKVKNMKGRAILAGITLATILTMTGTQTAAQSSDLTPNTSEKIVLRGYIRDLACLMKFNEALKPTNDCAIMCARAGSPLVIITAKGEIYTPISESIPDTSQRERLMPFVGDYVEVRGDVYKRAGMSAIVIRKIKKIEDSTK